MIKRNLIPFLVFAIVSIACITMSNYAMAACDNILQYSWNIQFGVEKIIISILKMIFLLIGGIVLFLLIKKKIHASNYKTKKTIFFSLLPLIIFYNQLVAIPFNLMNREIENSICDKTSVRGLTVESVNLRDEEYDYLRNRLYLLPMIPMSADKINVSYYTDQFLGDYNLTVTLECEINEEIDTLNQNWKIISKDWNRQKITYNKIRQ